jgi:hypothetical protein
MNYLLAISLFIVLLPSSVTAQRQTNTAKAPRHVSLEQLQTAIHNGFGGNVKVGSDLVNPFYVLGDFNGDGFSDIAVVVNIEEARGELKSHAVKYVDADPWSRNNGSMIDPLMADGRNCLGIAIIHGTALGWQAAAPADKFMLYNCFSSLRLIRKGQRIRRGSGSRGLTPIPKGDSIFLDLESGATALVYWNGKTYRGFGLRGGD